jgi:ligand-binding sensor domain-containing protein
MFSCRFQNILLIGIFTFNLLFGQYDPRFNPFDWITITKTGAITSITEGYSYIYFGTEKGGVLRYHIYANKMDIPLTVAQGLSSNNIQSVHFDFETGILWIGTDTGLDYSHMREGGWTHINKRNIGVSRKLRTYQIGSTAENLWFRTHNQFMKLDHNSGILISVMSYPDEEDIHWSASYSLERVILPEPIDSYFMMDGWIYNNGYLIDPHGRDKKITVFYSSRYGDVWLGINDGKILKGDFHMETFYPIQFGLVDSDVSAMYKSEDGFWVGGKTFSPEGITFFDQNQHYFKPYEFDININMSPQKIYSVLKVNDELWFGGSMGILVYNEKKDYWRLLDESKIQLSGNISTMTWDSKFVWIGSNMGISRVNSVNKRAEPIGLHPQLSLEPELKNEIIYDMEYIGKEIWIGTKYGLFIYDEITESVFDFRDFGNFTRFGGEENQLSDFSEIEGYNNLVYIATKQGLISYDKKTRFWMIVFRSNTIRQQKIYTMTFNENFGFFGYGSGLIKFDFEHFFIDEYSYPFLGNVNVLYLDDDDLWIGTSNGLTRFLWKND